MRKVPSILALLAALVLALGVTACGGSDDSGDDGGGGADVTGEADPEATQVIDDWATALTDGDVEGAADLFEIPSVAENGTPPLELDSRSKVIAFNKALPCGAELVGAESHAGFTIATFELKNRPGGDCGKGAGETAQTAFKIEDGHITEWRRVPGDLEPQAPAAEGPTV